MDNAIKDGLYERKPIPKKNDASHDRYGPNQVPKKPAENASKAGRSFKIK